MPKPAAPPVDGTAGGPRTTAKQTREHLREAARLRVDLMRVLDGLVHDLSADIAAHAGDAKLDPAGVMPAVRDLADVVSVMDRLTRPPRLRAVARPPARPRYVLRRRPRRPMPGPRP